MEKTISNKGELILEDVLNIIKNAVIFVVPQLVAQLTLGIESLELGIYGQLAALVLSSIVKGIEKYTRVTEYVKS